MPILKNKQVAQFLFIFALQLFTGLASAQVDPQIQWKVMHLPHFNLIYDAKHQELADLYADRLEDNLQFLSPYFTYLPERTTVVLDDRTDLTNGYATPIPYRLIVLYPVLPGPQETISDYGDWARELVMHEYTHILSFEPRRGLVKGLYYAFGNIVTPNILMPRWWLEGIAVDMETRNSDKGRLRSPYQDGSFRAYVVDHVMDQPPMGEINEATMHTWPQGARPYLFGSLLWSDMISRYGTKLIAELHNRQGGRMPYFNETPVIEETGSSYTENFIKTKDELDQRALKQIQELKKVPFPLSTQLYVKNGEENFHPVISPDGLKMIFLSKADSNKRSVRILVRPSLTETFEGNQETAEIKQRFGETSEDHTPTPKMGNRFGLDENDEDSDSPPGGTIQRLSWFPDSNRFIFDKLDNLNQYHEVSDLYVFDLKAMKMDRLTRGERAREASISPDEKTAVFVKLDAGRTHLALLDLDNKQSQIVYSPPLQARISFPTYISTDEIIFSERLQSREVLKKISLKTKQIQEVLTQFPDARFPTMTAKGLVFSSSLNGTGNTYLASADLSSARPITHTPTYISSSSIDGNLEDVYFSELSTKGYQIRHISLKNSELPAELPRIEPLLADRYPAVKRDVPVMAKPAAEDYSVWPYILPHYWLPNLYFYDGGAVVGGSVSGSDPLAKHAYTVTAAYDTEPEETSYSFIYANTTTPATLILKGLDYRTGIIHTTTRFQEKLYEADALWELSSITPDLFAGIGYRWIDRDFTAPRKNSTTANGPSLLATYSDLNMAGAQISPESGQTVNFSATEYLRGEGDQEDFHEYQLSVQKYFSKWLPRHHVVMVRAQGQYIDRNVNTANDAYTVSYNPVANGITPYYIMRGYWDGQFLGKSLANYSFEYRLPILYIYQGSGTAPLFLKRLHGALIADALTVDGFAYDRDADAYERVSPWKSFWSFGAELKLDVTLGYHFPLTFTAGFYAPQDTHYSKDSQKFLISVQM